MGSHSSMAQGTGRRWVYVLLVFGGLTVASTQEGDHEEGKDSEPSQSHFVEGGANAAHMGNHGKYFQYGHQDKDHYDMGHRRGNEHHFIERHEKGAPHHGHVSTKVRWGDKHGGYGEHYWDYNHDGHHDGADGDGTAPVAEYAAVDNEEVPEKKQSFQNAGREVVSSIHTRRGQQTKHPMPLDGFVAPTKVTTKVNPVRLPKAHVASERQIGVQTADGRLPSSWSPIPSTPSWNRPLTAHQLSRVRRSLRLPTSIFDRARYSLETRRAA